MPCPGTDVNRICLPHAIFRLGLAGGVRIVRLRPMRTWFREGFYGGLSVALLIALFLTWLWQPEHQARRHSENLLHAIAKKDWTRFAGFIGSDYQDQWGNDRALVLERTREVFRYLRNVRIGAVGANVRIDKGSAYWRARITVDGDGESMALLKERVNSLATPFQLEWCRVSAKPWNWKLVRVSNAELEIPSEFR
jgi:hypothetical protein